MNRNTLIGLGIGLTLIVATTAHAEIITVSTPTDLLDGNGATNATFGLPGANQVVWDVDGDGVDDLGFSHVRNTNFPDFWLGEVAVLDAAGVTGESAPFFGSLVNAARMVAFGDSVASAAMIPLPGDPATPIVGLGSDSGGFIIPGGDWGGVGDVLTRGILGFQLSSGNFGWVDIGAGMDGVFFFGAAYENSGADILAGAVPSPGALALLTLAGGIGTRRSRTGCNQG